MRTISEEQPEDEWGTKGETRPGGGSLIEGGDVLAGANEDGVTVLYGTIPHCDYC